MNRIKTDLLIIGAGSGGLSVAAGASQMGADVVLLDLRVRAMEVELHFELISDFKT